jgi:3-isopropylmalate/(R)-2-methylmalate dehydratase large subunit
MPMEGRFTLCNMGVEAGARTTMIAPDETTFEYVRGREFAPTGAAFEAAVAHWRQLASDEGANYDAMSCFDASDVAPQITWGTSPEQVIAIDAPVPDPARLADKEQRDAAQRALEYMAVQPGGPLLGLKIDAVFIGSCTNSRLSDLLAAADIVKGRKVASHVRAMVVPGSMTVKREAEALGLHRVFTDAGFEWREPGCSMCAAVNDDRLPPGARCVSTSNRNFEGRQGPGARTHLASPAAAAAAAIGGVITDPRRLGAQ